MQHGLFPVIDPVATGENIARLRQARGLSVRDVQAFFGFEEPQAIYKWQRGKSLPTVDNLYALGALLQVPLDEILVSANTIAIEQQAAACCSCFFVGLKESARLLRRRALCRLSKNYAIGKQCRGSTRGQSPPRIKSNAAASAMGPPQSFSFVGRGERNGVERISGGEPDVAERSFF